jgi:hypothetical protein
MVNDVVATDILHLAQEIHQLPFRASVIHRPVVAQCTNVMNFPVAQTDLNIHDSPTNIPANIVHTPADAIMVCKVSTFKSENAKNAPSNLNLLTLYNR